MQVERPRKYLNILQPRTNYGAAVLSKRQYIGLAPPVGLSFKKDGKKRSKRGSIVSRITATLGMLLVLGGITALVYAYKGNHAITEQVQVLEDKAIAQNGVGTASNQSGGTASEGQGESVVPTTSNKPTVSAVLGYKVDSNRPKSIEIVRLGVFAKIVQLGTNKKGQIDVPISIYDAGWYENSSLTQTSPGSTVIVGHLGSGKLGGVFEKLTLLQSGDIIVITNGDDTIVRYKVTGVDQVPLANMEMGNYLSYANSTDAKLYLITCSGKYVSKSFSFDHRAVVTAVKQP